MSSLQRAVGERGGQIPAGPPQGKLAPEGLSPAAPTLPAQSRTGRRAVASGQGTYREPHEVGKRGGHIQ